MKGMLPAPLWPTLPEAGEVPLRSSTPIKCPNAPRKMPADPWHFKKVYARQWRRLEFVEEAEEEEKVLQIVKDLHL